MNKTALLLLTLLVSIFCLAGCQNQPNQPNANNKISNVGKVPHSGGECAEGGGEPATAINSPVESYTFLFEAVKRGDTAAIKQISSQATREMSQFMASTYKKSCADSYKNGFTETTMQETMPQTRDLRMSDDGNVAAMEVKRKDGNWENVVFVKEGNGWKLGLGDLFFGKVQSPGKAQSVLEQENANARGLNNMIIQNPMGNNGGNKKGGNNNTFQPVPVPNEKIEKPLRQKPGQPPLANRPPQ